MNYNLNEVMKYESNKSCNHFLKIEFFILSLHKNKKAGELEQESAGEFFF